MMLFSLLFSYREAVLVSKVTFTLHLCAQSFEDVGSFNSQSGPGRNILDMSKSLVSGQRTVRLSEVKWLTRDRASIKTQV